jgi:hypothetical protein
MRGCVYAAEIGFRFDDASAVPLILKPSGEPRPNNFASDLNRIEPEKFP